MFQMKKLRKSIVSLMLVFVLILSQTAVFAEIDLIKRSEAGDQYKWDLTDIYADEAAFMADIETVEAALPKLEAYSGQLTTVDKIAELFAMEEEVSRKFWTAYVYANLMIDLDQRNDKATEYVSIVSTLYGQYASATSFVESELLELDKTMFDKLMRDSRLKDRKMYFQNLLDKKAHILSKDEEKILSLAAELSQTPNNVFDKVTLADKEKLYIENKDGEEVELTSGLYYQILEDKDRGYRAKAFEIRNSFYEKVNNTLSAAYEGEIKKNIFFAKARKFDSAIEASLSAEYVPKSVYDNLVAAVNGNLEYLHKYYTVRKEALAYDQLYGYDAYVPLTEDYKMEVSYDEANDIIATALKPLGDKYVADYKAGIADQWVDVYEDDNKYGGGYQWGTYDTHPYILMNYDNSLNSMLTLAHEMGHALNTKYSNEAQPYATADYTIFTAEVASTVNELLVMDYLIQNAKNDEEKLYLINQQIDNIRGTVYVQVMFSEFEKMTHEMVENGEPLTPEILNKTWMDLLKKYYGEDYTVLHFQQYGWSRIPHFYMNFYVYKYATSMSAAYSIVNRIKAGDENAVEDYLEFLAAGGSDKPIEILKATGVDMNSSEPVDSILLYFGELVDEFEMLLEK
jgi:oligoendopeptidase F